MTLNTFATREEAITVLARYFIQLAQDTIAEEGRFTVALSGGNSPRALYQLLADEPFRSKVDWEHVYFFFGDERYVPPSDANSNYHMARETLLDKLAIPADHIFPVDTSLEPAVAAESYQRQVFDLFKTETPSFDLVLLGLGDNAHTASLFPHTAVLQDSQPGVASLWIEEKQAWRITFNAPLINQARHIAFLVFGADKARAMQQVFTGDTSPDLYPARLIRKEHTAWFTDKDATALLS